MSADLVIVEQRAHKHDWDATAVIRREKIAGRNISATSDIDDLRDVCVIREALLSSERVCVQAGDTSLRRVHDDVCHDQEA